MTAVLAIEPFDWLQSALGHEFVRNAAIAGGFIGVATGLVGYFVVLRNQVFTGDALSHVAFTGSLVALVIGIDLRVGLFVATVLAAIAMSTLQGGDRRADVAIGTVFAWVLGIGVLMLALFTTSRSGTYSTGGTTVLFGSIFGISADVAGWCAIVGAGTSAALLAISRPLLFASIDPHVAAARGVAVRTLGVVLLGLVGLCVGEATQAVGALPVLGLIATPAAAAQSLSARPWVALWLSAAIAVGSVWTGLALSYAVPKLPPTFAIVGAAFAVYLAARLATGVTALARRHGARTMEPASAGTR